MGRRPAKERCTTVRIVDAARPIPPEIANNFAPGHRGLFCARRNAFKIWLSGVETPLEPHSFPHIQDSHPQKR